MYEIASVALILLMLLVATAMSSLKARRVILMVIMMMMIVVDVYLHGWLVVKMVQLCTQRSAAIDILSVN